MVEQIRLPRCGHVRLTSFRALMAIILALLISSIWGDKFINLLKRKANHRDATGCQYRPVRSKQGRSAEYGRVIIIFSILIPCLLLGKAEQYLYDSDAYHHCLVRLIGICRRLHQDIQKRQRRAAWQIQNHRSGRSWTDCRPYAIPQPAGCHS